MHTGKMSDDSQNLVYITHFFAENRVHELFNQIDDASRRTSSGTMKLQLPVQIESVQRSIDKSE